MTRRTLPALLLLGAASAAVLATLGGCASVPLSTMARLSTFDTKDFGAQDPGALRVRIKLPAAYTLRAEDSELAVSLAGDGGALAESFRLAQERLDRGTVPGGLLGDDVAVSIYTLRLPPASQEKFRQMQQFVAHKEPRTVSLDVRPRIGGGPRDATSIKVWMKILLRPEQGYLVLVDGLDVPFGHSERKL